MTGLKIGQAAISLPCADYRPHAMTNALERCRAGGTARFKRGSSPQHLAPTNRVIDTTVV